MKHIIFFLLLIGVIMGCETMPKDPSIKVGMAKSDIGKNYKIVSEELIMSEPGQFNESGKIVLANGTEFILVFNTEENVTKIITSDGSFRLPNGIKVDSTFSELKKNYSSYKTSKTMGYSRSIIVDDGTVFGFPWETESDNSKIGDDEKITWIELQEVPQ